MKAFFKVTGILVLFLAILSIQVNNRTIFSHIYRVISPATQYAQNATEDFFDRSMSSTQTYSKKLFDNSVPKVKDRVNSKLSAIKTSGGEPAEKITEEEKDQLNDLIKNH